MLELPEREVPSALAEPADRVRAGWTAKYAVANLGLFIAFMTPIQLLLPRLVDTISGAGKVGALGWVTGVGAFAALVVTPLAGAFSDRTTSRFGRRHPWTLGGALVGAVALVFTGTQHTVIGVLVGWFLAQTALNCMLASLTAAVPDRVPVGQRGVVSGWAGITQSGGIVLGALLVTVLVPGLLAGYVALALVVVACTLPFVLRTPDPPLPANRRPPMEWRAFLRGFWISPRAYPDFAWTFATRFLMMLGNAMATLYLLYFLKDAVHYDGDADDGVLILTAIYVVGVLATAVTGGALSDRAGRRPLVTVSAAVMAVAALMLTFWQTWPVAMAAAAVLGLGYGAYVAVDQAIITQVLPKAADRARDLGVINIANSAPQVLGPALAAPIVGHLGGYRGLYLVVAVATMLSGALVWRIRGVR